MKAVDLLNDPHFLLHQIIPAEGVALFVPTTRDLLSKPSFIDGRTDFSNGPAVKVALDDLLAQSLPVVSGPDRYIFHVAFCGSTLLARMLDHDGAAFVLKEPNILVDLANWQRSGEDARFAPTVQLVLACLRRRWTENEAVVVKPSNWMNNLLPYLATESADLRQLFVTMRPRAHLVALLRGGRDRLTFAARTAAHLAPSVPQGNAWLQAAISAINDPIGQTLNLALAALRLQERLFETHIGLRLDAEAIFADAATAARRASNALGLGLDPETIDAASAARTQINAKRPGHAFSVREREGEDAEVERHHGAAIDAALAWAEKALS